MTPDRALWLVALAAFVMHVRWSIQDWQSRKLGRLQVPSGLTSAPCLCKPGCEQRWVWES